MTVLGAVIVNYHTEALTAEAVASLRADAAEAGLRLDCVVVDNGGAPENAGLLAALEARVLRPGSNLGYAGGLVLGTAQIDAPYLLLMNPDVRVRPGCLAALVAELERGADACGPSLLWDGEERLRLPPTERRDLVSETLRLLAVRSPTLARRARARWRRHARRHWRASTSLPTRELSGALLAVRRSAWQAVGPFDIGYRLYFEETDWLHRLWSRGGRSLLVPAARAVHSCGGSSRSQAVAAEWFEQSRRLFERRHRSRIARAGLSRLERWAAARPAPAPAGVALRELALAPQGMPLWVELSPHPWGFPAAAERVPPGPARWRPPDEIADRMAGAVWQARVVDDEGNERTHAAFAFSRAGQALDTT
jgi:GT2 family glycosyltransferase